MTQHPRPEITYIDQGFEHTKPIHLGNPDLPIALEREALETSFTDNIVTVIESTTGSGKSTQVVQYLEQMRMEGRLDIGQTVLTQPRILAARSLSERIADEMRSKGIFDPKVGYYTQPEGSEEPQSSRNIAVLTEGKAAMQLLHPKEEDADQLRFLVIDEVHEFGKFTELLLAIAKRKTNPQSPDYDKNLRVVVMSATLDAKPMLDYFNHTTTGYVKVDVPTYPVELKTAEKEESAASIALKLAIEHKEKGLENSVVLTFAAGKGEIESMAQAIAKMQQDTDPEERIAVVALHAQQNAEEQQAAVDQEYKNGVIVLSTNVAETSITVPNVVAVVDTGEVRIAKARFDMIKTGSQELNLEHTARSSMDQRAGRAGRTQPGVRWLAKQMGGTPTPYEHRFRLDYPRAAIEIDEVDDLMLFAKSIGSELTDFDFYHKIPERARKAAHEKLIILGAIDEDGAITERGEFMASLPLNPEYACMVAYARERGFNADVQQNIMDIVAIMQRGGIFSRSPSEKSWRRLLEKDAKTGMPKEDVSDYIAQLEGYVALLKLPPETWHTYDVNVYAAERIRDRRESLARSLGIEQLGPATTVLPKNREAVLACIYAGQLAQIWQRNKDEWVFNDNRNIRVRPHPTSVVGIVGKYATGSVFSVGTYGKYEHAVQDINRILNLEILADVAKHIIATEVIEGSEHFVPEKQALFVRVRRTLGKIAFKEKTKMIDANDDPDLVKMLADAYAEHVIAQYVANLQHDNAREHRLMQYHESELPELIKDPESITIGTNIYDNNKPIVVYLGSGMRPMVSREAAVASLEAQVARAQKLPLKIARNDLKTEIKSHIPVIRKIKDCKKGDLAAKARNIMRGPNTEERLNEIKRIIADWEKWKSVTS